MNLNIYSNYVSPIFMSKKKIIKPVIITAATAATAALSNDTFTKSGNNPNVSNGTKTYTPQELAEKYQSNSKVDRLFEAYANNAEMQQNPHIKNFIEFVLKSYLTKVSCSFDQDLLLELFKNNTKNDDENYFKSLKDLFYNDIHPDLIRKIMSNKNYYNNLNHSLVFDIERFREGSVDNLISILNYYDNHIDSEWMKDHMVLELKEAFFGQGWENPYKYIVDRNEHISAVEKKLKSEPPENYFNEVKAKMQEILSSKCDLSAEEIEEIRLDSDDPDSMIESKRLKIKSREIHHLAADIRDMLMTKSVAERLKDKKTEISEIVDEIYNNLNDLEEKNESLQSRVLWFTNPYIFYEIQESLEQL